MRNLKRSLKKEIIPATQNNTGQYDTELKKITFRCDVYLLEKIKNTLTSQQLAGNYHYPNLSAFIRSALQAYQAGMPLTYQREVNHPKKEISFRPTKELLTFYQSLAPQTRTLILERCLGSYYQQMS